MKIILKNVERDIDENDFPKYEKLGYELLNNSDNEKSKTQKPLKKMNKGELLKMAEELGVEVDDAWTNPEIVEVVKKAQEELSSGGQ